MKLTKERKTFVFEQAEGLEKALMLVGDRDWDMWTTDSLCKEGAVAYKYCLTI